MRVLLAYGGSISADAAIEDLRRAGLPHDTEAQVVCVEDGNIEPRDRTGKLASDLAWASRLSEAEGLADAASERIQSYFPEWEVSAEVLWGTPAKIILNSIGAWHPDLVVVGSHGRSAVARVFLGSVSHDVVHKAPCSVRVVRSDRAEWPDKPICLVIGTDGSEEAEAVIRSVTKRVWPANSEVRLVSVAQTLVPIPTGLEASAFASEAAFNAIRETDEHERARLASVAVEAATALRNAGLNVTAEVVDGIPGEAIVARAKQFNADSIFVGSRGLRRMERLLLGSVSKHVVNHAPCAVEVVRQAAYAA